VRRRTARLRREVADVALLALVVLVVPLTWTLLLGWTALGLVCCAGAAILGWRARP